MEPTSQSGDLPIPEFLAKLPLDPDVLQVLTATGCDSLLEVGSMAYLGGERFALQFGPKGEAVRKTILENLSDEEMRILKSLPPVTPVFFGAVHPNDEGPI